MKYRSQQRWPRWLIIALMITPLAWAQPAPKNTPHPLIGQIWNTKQERAATNAELEKRLLKTRFLLLGEVHDNSSHHKMRLDMIAAMVRAGHRPALAMEQFDREQQPALNGAAAELWRDAERVRSASGFDVRGWSWPDYAPFVNLALEAGLPLIAANLSREQAFRIATSSATAVLGDAFAAALGLNQPLPEAAQRKLERAIDDGHCGKAPAKILPGMIAAQRARDAVMAQILERHASSGAVLLAGNGHVRRDFGVPHYLQAHTAPENIVAVGFIEVQDGLIAPGEYYDSASPEYDYIVFTARMARDDPCANLTFKPRQPTSQP
ncbi:MAG: hypothetical protein RJA24_1291 [Pseudomonadota bacterium]